MFAAGFGTRMKDLTETRPKPLIKVAGKPLIDHALELAVDAGCSPVAANLHYRADMLDEYLTPKGVKTIIEQPTILETGGGLLNALPVLGDCPVVTLNSDAIWSGPNPIRLLQQAWQPDRMDALLICVAKQDAIGHAGEGDFELANTGLLRRGPGLIYGGVQIIKTTGLTNAFKGAFSLNLIWDQVLSKGRLYGLPYPGKWCDVGHPDGIILAEDLLRAPRV